MKKVKGILVEVVKMDTLPKVYEEVVLCGYTKTNFKKHTSVDPLNLLNKWKMLDDGHVADKPEKCKGKIEMFFLLGDTGGSNDARVYIEDRPYYMDKNGRYFIDYDGV